MHDDVKRQAIAEATAYIKLRGGDEVEALTDYLSVDLGAALENNYPAGISEARQEALRAMLAELRVIA